MNILKRRRLGRHESQAQVVYIMGASRSGSTILGVLLGQAEGTFFAGELCDWPERDGVSTIPHSKALWDDIRACFGPLPDDAGRYKRVYEHPGGLLSPTALRRSLRREYEGVTRAVLNETKRETGCETIVDSSHYPRRAMALRRILGHKNVRLVFIVRRPSSVARSFRNSGDKGWLRVNLYLAIVGLLAWFTYLTHPGSARARVSYEALTRSPLETGQRALGRPLNGVDPTKMTPPMVFAGNRLVRGTGRIEIKRSAEPASLTIVEKLTDMVQWPYRIEASDPASWGQV